MQKPQHITRLRRTALSLATCSSFAAPPAVLVAGLTALAVAAPLTAQAADVAFDIPAGPLQAALVQFAAKTGANLQFDRATVADKTSPGVRGSFEAGEALRRLLQGTGLQATRSAQGDYVIASAPPAPARPPSAPAPAPARPPAAASAPVPVARVDPAPAADPSPLQLATVTVTGKRLESGTLGLVASNSRSATNTDTPIDEIPRGVMVVTGEQLERQQVRDVAEALRNVSGVSASQSGQGQTNISSRGFATTQTVDGQRSNIGNFPIVGVESVEFLKGADQVLLGTGTPGGVANINLKKPQAAPIRQGVIEVGSHGHLMTSLDLGGKVSDDSRWTYRVVGSAEQDHKSPSGFKGKQFFYLAPSLGLVAGDTEVTVGVDVLKAPRIPDGTVAVVTNAGAILPPAYPSSSLNDRIEIEEKAVHTELKQQLGNDWELEAKLRFSNTTITARSWRYGGVLDDSMLPLVMYTAAGFDQKGKFWNTQLTLSGPAKTGPVDHKLLFALAVNRSSYGFGGFFDLVGTPVDYRTASTGLPLIESLDPATLFPFSLDDAVSKYRTLSIQDQVKFGRFSATGSVVRTHADNPPPSAFETARDKSDTTSPSLGVVYALTDEWSVYAGNQRGMNPQSSLKRPDGSILPPTIYNSRQGGLKYSRKDGRLSGNFEIYKNRSQNVGRQLPGVDFYELVDGRTSRGFEIDVTGRLSARWEITASYAQGKASDTDRNFPDQIPKHTGKLWASYILPGESFKGWSVSGGITARSAYNGASNTSPNTGFRVPGGASVDLGAAYTASKWSATLSIKNAFDRLLYDTFANSTLGAPVQPGRVVVVTGRYNF